jgi:hypothetical protein
MDKWLDDTSNANGRRVECQTEDWPGSTPNPILDSTDEHVSTHATEEVLVIGSGASVGTQFRQVYFTHGLFRMGLFRMGLFRMGLRQGDAQRISKEPA